jgi:propionyl-CoA synthetase
MTPNPGETMFTTSDIGWVVGHSYIVYGPLIHGMTTIVLRGPADPPGSGHLVEDRQDHKVPPCSPRPPRSGC